MDNPILNPFKFIEHTANHEFYNSDVSYEIFDRNTRKKTCDCKFLNNCENCQELTLLKDNSLHEKLRAEINDLKSCKKKCPEKIMDAKIKKVQDTRYKFHEFNGVFNLNDKWFVNILNPVFEWQVKYGYNIILTRADTQNIDLLKVFNEFYTKDNFQDIYSSTYSGLSNLDIKHFSQVNPYILKLGDTEYKIGQMITDTLHEELRKSRCSKQYMIPIELDHQWLEDNIYYDSENDIIYIKINQINPQYKHWHYISQSYLKLTYNKEEDKWEHVIVKTDKPDTYVTMIPDKVDPIVNNNTVKYDNYYDGNFNAIRSNPQRKKNIIRIRNIAYIDKIHTELQNIYNSEISREYAIHYWYMLNCIINTYYIDMDGNGNHCRDVYLTDLLVTHNVPYTAYYMYEYCNIYMNSKVKANIEKAERRLLSYEENFYHLSRLLSDIYDNQDLMEYNPIPVEMCNTCNYKKHDDCRCEESKSLSSSVQVTHKTPTDTNDEQPLSETDYELEDSELEDN